MKKQFLLGALMASGLGLAGIAPRAVEAVTDEEFKTLQQQLQQLQKQREEDRKEMQQLKERLGEAEKKAGEAQKVASEAAAKVPPTYPLPSEEASAKQNFLLTGYAHALYEKTEGENGSFLLGSFNPIFLYRFGDKILFEGELEIEVETEEEGESETEVSLEYAQIDYAFNDYVTLIAGRFILPLGTFNEKIHPAWINKLPTRPLPYAGHDAGLLPFNDIGVQARGAWRPESCDAVLSYALYGVNGPGSELEEVSPGMVEEELHFSGGADLNDAPSAGGRIAVFYPWASYNDIEVGVSGQSGTWNRDADLLWSAFVVDAALHLGPYTELRGEYIHTWQETDEEGTLQPRGAWAQAAYKLAGLGLELPMINNAEGVFRWSYVDTDMEMTKTHAFALGLNYYIVNTLQFKAAYEFITSDENHDENNRLSFQIAYGF